MKKLSMTNEHEVPITGLGLEALPQTYRVRGVSTWRVTRKIQTQTPKFANLWKLSGRRSSKAIINSEAESRILRKSQQGTGYVDFVFCYYDYISSSLCTNDSIKCL